MGWEVQPVPQLHTGSVSWTCYRLHLSEEQRGPVPPLRDQWLRLADESSLLSEDMEKWHGWPGTSLNTSSLIFLPISKRLHSVGDGESWALLGICTQLLSCNDVHKAKISRATRQPKSRHNHQTPEWCHTWNQLEVLVQLLADDCPYNKNYSHNWCPSSSGDCWTWPTPSQQVMTYSS